MKSRFLITLLLIMVIPVFTNAMNKEKKDESPLSVIYKWGDVTPFYKKIVVYEPSKYGTYNWYFSGCNLYLIGPNKNLKVGFIGCELTDFNYIYGYQMAGLIKKDGDFSLGRLLIKEVLREGLIEMRNATELELIEIKRALENNEAEFESGFTPEF